MKPFFLSGLHCSPRMAAEEGRFQLFPEDGGVLETSRGFTGKARAQYADGSVFEGNYVKGRREGFGVYTHASGDKFEGEYSNDKRHGTGRMEFADGGFFHGQCASYPLSPP